MDRKTNPLPVAPERFLPALLRKGSVRQFELDGAVYYAARDVVSVLGRWSHPGDLWAQIKRDEPGVAELVRTHTDGSGGAPVELLDFAGVLRLAQAIPGPRAERVKRWLAGAVRQWVAEQANPDLAIARVRKSYARHGRGAAWIDKRLRATRSRQEATREWARRGATHSDDYRALTNELFRHAFGKDVQAYRAEKALTNRPGESLRDHMSDEELLLTTLGESSAAVVSRRRDSHGLDELLDDVRHAGEIVRHVRESLDERPRAHPADVDAQSAAVGTDAAALAA